MPQATFVHDGWSLDYTPEVAIAAGDVVVQGDLVGVAKRPIAANELGALDVEGVFDFTKAASGGVTFAVGALAYWDATNDLAVASDGSGAYKLLGKVVRAAVDADATVRVRLCPCAVPGSSSSSSGSSSSSSSGSWRVSDLLNQGSAWLEGQRKKFATREVTYRRAAEAVVVKATIGRTEFEQDDGAGLVVCTQVRDYLIDTVDMVLAGQPTLPAKGDRIEETEASKKYVYEVLPLGGEQHWRYSDPYRRTLRIHTKLIASEDI